MCPQQRTTSCVCVVPRPGQEGRGDESTRVNATFDGAASRIWGENILFATNSLALQAKLVASTLALVSSGQVWGLTVCVFMFLIELYLSF